MSEMTAEELKEFEEFKAAKAKARAEEKKKEDRKAYGELVDETIAECIPMLADLSQKIRATKSTVYGKFEEILKMKAELLNMTKDGQQSHTFTNSDSTMRLTLGHYMIDGYKDTCEDGIQMVKEYIVGLAKDEDTKVLVDAIMRLLSKDQKGTLKASRIIQLRKMAEDTGDEKFLEGVRIIEESYNPTSSCSFIRAEKKNSQGKWEIIPLNVTDC